LNSTDALTEQKNKKRSEKLEYQLKKQRLNLMLQMMYKKQIQNKCNRLQRNNNELQEENNKLQREIQEARQQSVVEFLQMFTVNSES